MAGVIPDRPLDSAEPRVQGGALARDFLQLLLYCLLSDRAQRVQLNQTLLSLLQCLDLAFQVTNLFDVCLQSGLILKLLEHDSGISKYSPYFLPHS